MIEQIRDLDFTDSGCWFYGFRILILRIWDLDFTDLGSWLNRFGIMIYIEWIQILLLSTLLHRVIRAFFQCLGSGSVGSARFWLPGSGSTKISGSKGQNINQKLQKKIKINWSLSTAFFYISGNTGCEANSYSSSNNTLRQVKLKGTGSVIISDPPWKNDNARFTMVPLKSLSDQ